MSTSKTGIMLRLEPRVVGELNHLCEVLRISRNELISRMINEVMTKPGTGRVLTMSYDEVLMSEVDNMRAGKPRNEGMEILSSMK